MNLWKSISFIFVTNCQSARKVVNNLLFVQIFRSCNQSSLEPFLRRSVALVVDAGSDFQFEFGLDSKQDWFNIVQEKCNLLGLR